MVVSHSSVLICLLSGSFLILFTWLALRKDALAGYLGKYVWFVFLCLSVRMLVPIEFRFTRSIYSSSIMTRFQDLMNLRIGIGGSRVSVSQMILYLWIAGAMVRLLFQAVKYVIVTCIVRKCPLYAGFSEQDIDRVIDRINQECGKKKAFEIRLAAWTEAPAVFGIVRPRILMPVVSYTEEELRYILKHEMLHYYHHDVLLKILCEILCSIYWWNPGVYWMRRQVAQTIELKTDASLVLGLDMQGVTEYMMCIVKTLKEGPKRKKGIFRSFLGLKQGSLVQRFYFMEHDCWNAKRSRGILVAAVSLGLLFLSFLFIFEPAYKDTVPESFECPNPETSYLVRGDGCYEVYMEDEYIAYVYEITEPLIGLKVFEHMEEGAYEGFMQNDYSFIWGAVLLGTWRSIRFLRRGVRGRNK